MLYIAVDQPQRTADGGCEDNESLFHMFALLLSEEFSQHKGKPENGGQR
jgi:hypothetical protein